MNAAIAAPLGDPSRPVSRRYEPTIGMFIYSGVSLFLAIGAINSQNNLLFWAFGAAIGVMVISGFVSGPALYHLRATRHAPRVARVGEAASIRYDLVETGRSATFALVIRELPADRRSAALGIVAGCSLVPGRGRVRAHATWTPDQRGVVPLSRFEISSTFPFGLLRKVLVFDQPSAVLVGPARLALRPAVLAAAPAHGFDARRSRPRVGSGDELHALRDYTPGDPVRSIAWRASARSGGLLVRQNADVAAPRLHIALAPPHPSDPEHAWEIAIALTCAVAAQAIRQRWRASVSLPGAGLIIRDAVSISSLAPLVEAAATLPRQREALRTTIPRDPSEAAATLAVIVTPGTLRGGDTSPRASVIAALDVDAWLAHGSELPASLRATERGPAAKRSGHRSAVRGTP